MKWAWIMSPDKAGLSKESLFLESELGEEAVIEASEVLPAGLVELEGTIWVQTAALQG